MLKKLMSFLLCMVILMQTVPVLGNSTIKLVVNGNNIEFPDQKPIELNDRTYVPIRYLAEALGAEVEWDEEHQVVSIDNKGLQITDVGPYKIRYYLKINEPQMVYVKYADGFAIDVHVFDIPEKPILKNGRTMLPFRYVAELLGVFVYYDDVNHAAVCLTDSYKTDILGSRIKMPFGLNAVLTTVMQEAFQKELGVFRDKQAGKQPLTINDELMASAGWKVYDIVTTGHYETKKHSNSDGTYTGARFFSLCKPTKFPDGLPYSITELINISRPIAEKPFCILSSSEDKLVKNYFYDFDSVSIEQMLDDTEYWYEILGKDWGISMHELDVQSDVVIGKHNLNKYKMSSTVRVRYQNYPLHASYVITHWNKEEYERYARMNVHGWEISPKHKDGMLRTSIYMGFATQIVEGMSGDYSGASTLHISEWDYWE